MARDDDGLRIGQARGPYDIEALDTTFEELQNSHLDLGSVLVPVVQGGQVTVDMTADHRPETVYLVTPFGRISVAAFAAPKSPGLWREVVRELAESLRDDSGAATSIEDGHWGREVVAEVPGGIHRFIGVDGPRWMVRCVASGPPESAVELGQLARAVLAESVVRRGRDPYPPREALPIVLPQVLAEQVAAAQQRMAQEAEQQAAGEPASAPEPTEQQSAAQQPTGQQAAAPIGVSDELDPAVDDELIDDVEDQIPGGALDQLAQATVVSYPDDEPEVAPAVESESDSDAAAQQAARRSSGSAMQRLRRRSRRS